jgi:hypothetical protein
VCVWERSVRVYGGEGGEGFKGNVESHMRMNNTATRIQSEHVQTVHVQKIQVQTTHTYMQYRHSTRAMYKHFTAHSNSVRTYEYSTFRHSTYRHVHTGTIHTDTIHTCTARASSTYRHSTYRQHVRTYRYLGCSSGCLRHYQLAHTRSHKHRIAFTCQIHLVNKRERITIKSSLFLVIRRLFRRS